MKWEWGCGEWVRDVFGLIYFEGGRSWAGSIFIDGLDAIIIGFLGIHGFHPILIVGMYHDTCI
jgi:hypothetical protein